MVSIMHDSFLTLYLRLTMETQAAATIPTCVSEPPQARLPGGGRLHAANKQAARHRRPANNRWRNIAGLRIAGGGISRALRTASCGTSELLGLYKIASTGFLGPHLPQPLPISFG